jgi:hypothetical protein
MWNPTTSPSRFVPHCWSKVLFEDYFQSLLTSNYFHINFHSQLFDSTLITPLHYTNVIKYKLYGLRLCFPTQISHISDYKHCYHKVYPPILHVNLILLYQHPSPLLGPNMLSILFTNTLPLCYLLLVRDPLRERERERKRGGGGGGEIFQNKSPSPHPTSCTHTKTKLKVTLCYFSCHWWLQFRRTHSEYYSNLLVLYTFNKKFHPPLFTC